MSKTGKFFDSMLSFSCEDKLRQQLVALAYLRGDAGAYANLARTLMREVVKEQIEGLDPQELKDYKKILESVRTRSLVSRIQRQEQQKEKEKIKRHLMTPP